MDVLRRMARIDGWMHARVYRHEAGSGDLGVDLDFPAVPWIHLVSRATVSCIFPAMWDHIRFLM